MATPWALGRRNRYQDIPVGNFRLNSFGRSCDIHPISFAVDRVFCISLSARTDRRELFGREVATFISNEVEFFIAEPSNDPVRGCYESHQAIAIKALSAGWERVLIFEDDAKPYKLGPRQICWINRFLQRGQFEVLHLGYTMGRTWLTWFLYIACGRVVALHAYVLSHEGCRVLAETPFSGEPVDVMFKRKMKQHCVFPMLFRQQPAVLAGSNIETCAMNDDEWWDRNWRRHQLSPIKNIWRTLLRFRF
jgi:hypothetical protein